MNNKPNLFSSWSEVTSGERNDLVFEHLNKSYGAYNIRVNYDRTLLKSLFATVLSIVLLSGLSFLRTKEEPIVIIPDTPTRKLEDIYIDLPKVTPIVQVNNQVSAPKNPNAFLQPIVTTDSILETDSVPLLVLNNPLPPGNSNDTGGTNIGVPIAKKGGGNFIEETDSTFDGVFIQEPPTFPGGDKALFGFLQENIYYPEEVKEVGGKGIVGVSFVLDKEGKVTEVMAIKSSKHSKLDNEAVRVIKILPKWNPGKQQGKPVKVRMILPIRFELKQ